MGKVLIFGKRLIWKSFFRTASGFQLHSAQFILQDELRDFCNSALIYRLQNWLIYWFFFSLSSNYHEMNPFLKERVPCKKIISFFFFLIAAESSSSKAVSLKIEEVFEFNENRHFTETKNNVCQGSWLFVSQVFLFLSLSLFWAPCIIADSRNTENNKIQ